MPAQFVNPRVQFLALRQSKSTSKSFSMTLSLYLFVCFCVLPCQFLLSSSLKLGWLFCSWGPLLEMASGHGLDCPLRITQSSGKLSLVLRHLHSSALECWLVPNTCDLVLFGTITFVSPLFDLLDVLSSPACPSCGV